MAKDAVKLSDPLDAAKKGFELLDDVIAKVSIAHGVVLELDIEVANETGTWSLKRVRGPIFDTNPNAGYVPPDQAVPPLNKNYWIPEGFGDAMSYELNGAPGRDGIRGFVVYSVGTEAWFMVGWQLWHQNPGIAMFGLLTGGTHSLYLGEDEHHTGYISDADLIALMSRSDWPNGLMIVYDSDGKQVPGGRYKWGTGNGDGASITEDGPLVGRDGPWGVEVSLMDGPLSDSGDFNNNLDNHYALRCSVFKGADPPSVTGFYDPPPET